MPAMSEVGAYSPANSGVGRGYTAAWLECGQRFDDLGHVVHLALDWVL